MEPTKDENNQAVQTEVEAETTQEAPPPSEVQPTVEQTAVTTEESVETTDMNEEQRRAFQEQRLEIKRLKEEVEARKSSESAFAPFRPQPQPTGVDPNQFVDPSTGERNEYAYQTAIMNQSEAKARLAAQEELDEYQARQKYPELFSNERTEKLIASQWLYEQMRGNKVPISKIAEEFDRDFKRSVSKAEKIGAEKILTEVSPKEQAAMAASAQTSNPARQAQSDDELEQLRRQSRGRGRESEEAVATRMKNIPWEK